MVDFTRIATSGVSGLTPYQPGKPVEELQRELGLENIVKLASNENPLGPSPLGVAAAANVISGMNIYPDDMGFRLRNRLAEKYQLAADCITLGSGSSDVIDMVVRSFLGPGRNAVYSEHSFAMYPIYTQASGAQGKVAAALPADHPEMPYGHDLDAMLALVDDDTRVVFIANPNNPTGTWLTSDVLRGFIEKIPAKTIIVLDEAYTEYVRDLEFPNGLAWLEAFPNLIVTRTFSKIYGLAGLRVGYGVCSPALASVINRVRHPFNVNSAGLAAAEAALDDDLFLASSIENNHAGLKQLMDASDGMGLSFIPSVGNFLCINVGRSGAELFNALLRQGVIVRPVGNYKLPNHLRVTVGTPAENQSFITALNTVLELD